MKKKVLIIFGVILLFVIGSIFVGNTDNRLLLSIKDIVPQNIKTLVADKVFFVFKQKSKIAKLEKANKMLDARVGLIELNSYQTQKILNQKLYDKAKKRYNLPLIEDLIIKAEDKSEYRLTKYFFPTIPWQLNDRKPGGYLYKYNDDIFVLSGLGEINYFNSKSKNSNEIILNKIDSNIKEIKGDFTLYSKRRFGFRGIMITDEKIYISYQNKVKDDCYNMSIISANLNYEFLEFRDFFTFPDLECSKNMSNHTGGKMILYDDENFLFTVGDGQMFSSVQKDNSLWGKLIKINFTTKKHTMIAKGMRDTQGAYYYKDSKVLVMTEHGPQGGDEINTLKEEDFSKYKNFGWPVASYGKVKYNIIDELKYENHEENGFQEPAYWYKKNSIAPSAVVNVDGFFGNSKRDFLISTMGNIPAPGRRSLHHLKFNEDFTKADKIRIIPIKERIRDLFYLKESSQIILILENTPSVAFLEKL